MRNSTKRAVVIVSTLALTGVAGAAWADWLANGTGNAAAKAGEAQQLVVKTVESSTTLYPQTTGDATITITNPNGYGVAVNKVVWAPSDGVTATGGKGSCNNTGVYFGDFSTGTAGSNGVLAGLHLFVKGGDTKTFTLPDAVRMINGSEDGCQGATFSIPVEVSGLSAES